MYKRLRNMFSLLSPMLAISHSFQCDFHNHLIVSTWYMLSVLRLVSVSLRFTILKNKLLIKTHLKHTVQKGLKCLTECTVALLLHIVQHQLDCNSTKAAFRSCSNPADWRPLALLRILAWLQSLIKIFVSLTGLQSWKQMKDATMFVWTWTRKNRVWHW